MIVCQVTTALAIDPDRAMGQYIHDRWESDKGFPGGAVHAITQSSDGYLWIAADKGLVRFDGLAFRLFQPRGLTSGQDPTVLALASDVDGGVWAELRNAMLMRYRNGFEDLPSTLGALGPAVTAMTRDPDGAVLFAVLAHGIIRYRSNRLETIVAQLEMPSSFVIAIARTPDGDIWLGTRDSGLLRIRGGRLTPIVKGLPDQKINSLLPDGQHDLWIGTDNGVARWNGAEVTRAGLPAGLEHVQALGMIRDRDSNVWIGTASGELLRVNRHGVASFDERDRRRRGIVTGLFEDRDGNLWIGTTRGIERIRDGAFTTYSSAQGLPSDVYGPVYVDSDRTWVAPADGGLYWMRGDQVRAVKLAGLDRDIVYSISGGAGDVWLGRQRGGLTRLRAERDSFSAQNFTPADGLAQNTVYAVHRSRDGSVWAGTLSGGVSRFKNGAFTTFTTADGLASNTVNAVVEAADGTIWLATPNGVNARSSGGWRRYSVADGLPSNEVITLFEDSTRNIWIGTAAGLALFRDGRVQPGFQPPPQLRSSILGVAEDRGGWLWIATADHVLRVDRERLVQGSQDGGSIREYGAADGLLSVEGVKRHRSVAADAAGRIWLSMNRGLSMTDPNRASGRAAPALVHVQELLADGATIDQAGPITVPPRRQRVTLTYTGLSLSAPERVLFRYRLDGFDRDWSEATPARQAVYTNLDPGPYQFHVKASNSEGVWNGPEATFDFSIAAAFWQTTTFRLSVLLLFAGAVWAAYRVRMLQVARQMNLRFEERLAERTRIAQELHDTLLQGFVSVSMQLHVVADRLPADSPAKPLLTRVLDLTRRVIEEGRNAVRGLRSSISSSHDLEVAFSAMSEELAADRKVDYRVIIEGRDRPLKPIIRDELYRIGREAVVNAFRHSEARTIELELEYASKGLRMLVTDDGRGIDGQVLQSGRDGHWGLSGMHERADRIGARLKVWSRAGGGTEIELSVPARVAFAQEKKP